MAKKDPFYNYKGLFEWMFQDQLPDQWYIAVNGNQRDELYSLEQIRQFHLSSPTSHIQVLNSQFAAEPSPHWLQYGEADQSAGSAVGCAYVAAFLFPIVGFLVGLALIPNDKTRSQGVGAVMLSVIMAVIYWIIFLSVSRSVPR